MNSCPKCNGAMTEGFIVDHGDYGAAHVATYQKGEPTRTLWMGLQQNKEEQIPIVTLRCGRCGYLENYARG